MARAERERLLGAGPSGGAAARAARRGAEPPRRDRARSRSRSAAPASTSSTSRFAPSQDNSQGVVALWLDGEADVARASELIAELGFPVAQA